MKDIYTELIARVEQGENFVIDFANKNLKIGKEVIINGEINDGYLPDCVDAMRTLNDLYYDFKYSRPSEHENGKYFKALRADELTDEQLIIGGNRELARAKLEFHVLNMMLHGCKWSDITDENHWFYEGPEGYILLREWF